MLLERLGKELLYFDGGMGTLLQSKGLQPGELPEVWNLEHAEEIIDIHKAYFEAGSDIVLAPTFTANRIKLDEYGLVDKIEEMNHQLVAISKAAAGDRGFQVWTQRNRNSRNPECKKGCRTWRARRKKDLCSIRCRTNR